MNTTINFRAIVYPNKGVVISFEHYLEVSLDCAHCSRTDRTVIFDSSNEHGFCTASSFCDPEGWHDYSGRIGRYSVVETNLLFRRKVDYTFLLTYEYTSVIDRKYPSRISTLLPRDARVMFKMTCPKCHVISECYISTHDGKPGVVSCDCGYALYTQNHVPVSYNVSTDTLCE
jgi:hypothetical protein